MNPGDALRAIEVGCDGIQVSTTAAASSTSSSLARRASGIQGSGRQSPAIVLDGGVRARGHRDCAVPRCRFFVMGAQLYGAAAGGLAGQKGIDIFRTEIDLVMGRSAAQPRSAGSRFSVTEDWRQNA